MSNPEENQTEKREKPEKPEKQQRDWLKIFDIISKFATAIVVVAIGFYGNKYLSKKEADDRHIQLYTQLLSNKETAENTLRKDMFEKILQSFFTNKNATGIDHIREMRLNLELLSRNFHESLDIKPLFEHLLMKIIQPRSKLRNIQQQLNELNGKDGNPLDPNIDEKKGIALKRAREAISMAETGKIESSEKENNLSITEAKAKVDYLYDQYDRELYNLVNVAKRVTRKQLEVLEQVAEKIPLEIPFADKKNEVCISYNPNQWMPKDGTCQDQAGRTMLPIKGVWNDRRLVLKDSGITEIRDSARHFELKVRYAYPKWRRVYVEIDHWACRAKGTCSDKTACKTNFEPDASAFWLEYFDFPLVDNTLIGDKYRYSVILEDFEEGKNGQIEKAKILLLYYPASYAGLREKSFYNNQLLNGLLNSDLFRKESQ